MAVLGLRFCVRAFSSCGKRGPLFIAVRGPLTVAASLVAEHKLQMRRLSNCGSRAQLLRGMWDLPRPGLEPVSPALAGWFSTTAPPGKPNILYFKVCFVSYKYCYPGFLFISICIDLFSNPLTLSLCVSLDLKWVSCGQHKYGSCFCIHSATLCLLIGAFSPFTFKVIVDMCVLIGILLIVFVVLFCSFLLLFFSSLVIWWLSSVLCLDSSLFFCVCVYYRFFYFVVKL